MSRQQARARVLLMARYGRLGASSRLRFQQFIPALTREGFRFSESALLDDDYVRGLYAGRVRYAQVGRAYLRRMRQLLETSRYDLVWVEKELLPWVPAVMELGFLPRGVPFVVDYDDAVFHRYDEHGRAAVRMLLGNKIDHVMRRASVVTAGNDYLAERARQAGCRRVELLPTVVDLGRYGRRDKRDTGGGVTVGWIGSPATAKYLQFVAPVLEHLQDRYDLRCVAIGARPDQVQGTPFEAVPWSEDAEVERLRQLDVGIMPLPDEPWERGKCGYKLIQYMAVGLPVVASPVGVNRDIVEHGDNGYLAGSVDEWKVALESLIADAGRRESMGAAGYRRVETSYSLQVQAPRLSAILASALGDG